MSLIKYPAHIKTDLEKCHWLIEQMKKIDKDKEYIPPQKDYHDSPEYQRMVAIGERS